MSDRLVIGLSAWIVQDGNYGDFSRGDRAAFALEFCPSATLSDGEPQSTPSLVHVGNALYEAIGRVVHVADDWWTVDFGTLAFQDAKPPTNVRPGTWVRGEIFIGIDPFFYFERLAREPDAPALIYDWEIEKIEMQTAPFIEVRPRLRERDPARLGWTEIAETDAWKDDGGLADYVLHCRRLDGSPRHAVKTI